MKRGLLGYPLGQTYSPVIHKLINNQDYVIFEKPKEELDEFFEKREFSGINVIMNITLKE